MPIDNDNNTNQAADTAQNAQVTSNDSNTPPPAAAPAASQSGEQPQAATPAAPAAPAGDKGETKAPVPGDAKQDKSPLLAKIKTVLSGGNKTATGEQGTPPAKPAADQQQQQQPQKASPQENLLGKIDDAEWKALPEKTRRRITAFRDAVRAQDAAIKTAQPKAKAYDDLMGYVAKQRLSQEDFTFGLDLVAAVKNDPQRAWQALQPIIAHLGEHVGERLPDDIQKRVTSGEISEAAGKELARARASGKHSETQRAIEREEVQQRDAAAKTMAARTNVMNAVHGWEQQWRGSDPDYAKKWPRVWERMLAIITQDHGGPQNLTPQQVVQIGHRARKEVEEWLAEVTPRTPVREVRTVTGGANTRAAPAPKSVLEAAKAAYAGSRRAVA